MINNFHSLLTKDSVILITGGGKGITAKCAIEIAKETGCKFVLVGRSLMLENEPVWAAGKTTDKALKESALLSFKQNGEKASPKKLDQRIRAITSSREIKNTLAEIENAGAQVVYLSADVTDNKSLSTAIDSAQAKLGKISGLIHGAGNLADKRIESKTGADFDKVVNTKVKGLENILANIDTGGLKFLVLFSSVAGFFGNSGQTDYAIANEILNKSAHHLQKTLPDCRVLAINWGPWDSGMVTPRLKKFFEMNDIPLISSSAGVKVLTDALTKKSIPPQIVVGRQLAFPTSNSTDQQKEIIIRREIVHSENPFLDDHRLGPQAVLPATCAAAWVIDVCMALNPGYFFTRMDDFKILKGLTFDDNTHQCDVLIKTENNENSIERSYTVQITSQNERGKKVFHYSGGVTLAKDKPAILSGRPIEDQGLDKSGARAGKNLYSNGTLFHGHAFQGVKKILSLSENQVITEVFLPEMDLLSQGQFRAKTVNPFINDTVVQSLLIWTQTYYEAPCLPSRLHAWENYRFPPFGQPLHVILDVTYHNENAVTGNLMVQDFDGNAYFQFTGLEGTISKHLKRFFKPKIAASA